MNEETINRRMKTPAARSMHGANLWITLAGRCGYTAKGVIFIIIGVLAAYSAISASAANDGTRSAMRHVEDLPFGQFLLVALTLGLVLHAVWRFAQAWADTEKKGAAAKGIVIRAVYAVIGFIYLGLAFSAVKIILGIGEISGFRSENWTDWLLAQTFGQWLVGVASLVVAGIGLFQFYQATTAKFQETLRLGTMSERRKSWLTRIGRFGFAARGAVFGIISFFLISAAYQAKAGEIRGLGGALHALELQPFGAWLLGLTAAGFIAYGGLMLVLAKYRLMVVEED